MQRNMPGGRSTIATEILLCVVAMVNKKNASHAIRQPERTGLAEFSSEIAMWGDKPLRLRLSLIESDRRRAVRAGSRFTDMQNMNPETLARTSERRGGDNQKEHVVWPPVTPSRAPRSPRA